MLLTSARLRLRPVTSRDEETLLLHWSVPSVRRWLWDDRLPTEEEVRAVIDSSEATWKDPGYGFWIIELLEQLTFLGTIGFRESSWEPEVCELVYSLDPGWWGKGIATEAATTALAWAFATHRWPKIVAATDTPNVESQRVLERIGMQWVSEGVLENGLPTRFYAAKPHVPAPSA